MKRCKECGIDLEDEDFHRNKDCGDRLQAICKVCSTAYNANSSAINRGLPAELTTFQWRFALMHWNYSCAICGCSKGLFNTIAADHWIPLASRCENNPGSVTWNILPLCHAMRGGRGLDWCNTSKNDKDPVDWLIHKLGEVQAQRKLKEINFYFGLARLMSTQRIQVIQHGYADGSIRRWEYT